VDKLLTNFAPKEVLFERGRRLMFEGNFGGRFFTFELDDWIYTDDSARKKLLTHFGTKNLKGYGVEHLKNGVVAAGAILYYLEQTQHTHISHIRNISQIEENRYVRMDKFTVRSLELLGSMNEGGNSLLSVIDKTVSPMGARMLRRWVVFPLKSVKPIVERQDVVEHFFREPELRDAIEECLLLGAYLLDVWYAECEVLLCNHRVGRYSQDA
jgi:DNA mismatch repair protein MutS